MSQHPPDTMDWFRRWQQGDAKASEELFRRLAQGLRPYATNLRRRYGLQSASATDLLHDAFVRLLEYDCCPRVEERRHLFGILNKAVWQTLIDRLRKKTPACVSSMVLLDRAVDTWLETTGFDRERLAIFLARLEQDRPRQYAVFQRRFTLDQPIEDIAQELEISQATVYGDLRLAKAWLRNRMTEAKRA